jgi:hypothetical protein
MEFQDTIQFDSPQQIRHCVPFMHFLTVDTNLAFVPSLWGLHNNIILLILSFRRALNVIGFLLGVSPASECKQPTFRNTLSVPSSKAGR